MAKQTVNIGTSDNKGNGDPLRTAFTKINANFDELYAITGGSGAALQELAQDYAAPMFVHAGHTNITFTYNDATNRIIATVPSQVNSDWAASSGVAQILNKPTIPTDISDLTDTTGLLGGGGNANTGDITFNGVKIIGAGTASGDGLGYSTLEIVPDNNLYDISPGGAYGLSGGQYLIVDPTNPQHIHIRAGGPVDESAAQLILGGEKANVVVRDQDNSYAEKHWVTINSQSTTGDVYSWQFLDNGDLDLPNNGGIVFDRNNTSIRVGMGFHIASGEGVAIDAIDQTDPENLVYKSWGFGVDGSLSFPGGMTIATEEGGSNRLILNGQAEYVDVRSDSGVLIGYSGTGSVAIGNPNGGTLTEILSEKVKFLLQSVPASSIGAAGDVPGLIAFDQTHIYYCMGTYNGVSDIWKRVAWSNDTW